METKWLEDFVTLAKTRNFSRAAQLRHVTQPAFSRRIQALEAWAGTDLVDRSAFPTCLTAAGQTLVEQAEDLLLQLNAARSLMRSHATAGHDVIEFACPHTIALAFFPSWLSKVQGVVGSVKVRLTALNVHDAAMRLADGSCDFLISYHHPAHPLQLDLQRYDMLPLGAETLAPYCRRTPSGEPLHPFPGLDDQPVPYLAYAPGAYLGRVVDGLLKELSLRTPLERVYETDMAEGLKAMALEGHGVAFLPSSAVASEVAARRLVCAHPSFAEPLDIRLYRPAAGPNSQRTKTVAQRFWQLLNPLEEAKPTSKPQSQKG